jgi:hypothetical protein
VRFSPEYFFGKIYFCKLASIYAWERLPSHSFS